MSAPSKPPFRLIVEPMCGLCNRMRVIDSALAIAKEGAGTLDVFWFCDPDLNCRFTDLFQPLDGPIRFWHFSLPTWLEQKAKRILHAVMKRSSRVYLRELEIDRMATSGRDFRDVSGPGRVFLKTWNRLTDNRPPFANFRPVPAIQRLIDQHAANLGNAVGVHIRRTDCTAAVEGSPTNKFLAQMRRELLDAPETHFFLATDDPVEETALRAAFPGKIQTYPKRTISRNERAGIEDAVVDLFCLARCRKILGSEGSSFSDTARTLQAQFVGCGASDVRRASFRSH